jgi:AcrR family transcriptional regulator
MIEGEMTDSSPNPRSGKRERLVASALDVLHRQGVETTTLADIAREADVPVGNVYYYFKTKDDLVDAAIESRIGEIEATLRSLEDRPTPQARIKALIKALCAEAELVARYGCALGSLCSELDKRDDRLDRSGARLLDVPIKWLEKQFRDMGRRDASELAMALMASYQGTALLTNTFRDPKIMTTESRRLEHWIDSLSRG